MATPSKKSPEMTNFLDRMFGRTFAIESDLCVTCSGPAEKFRDDLSRKEYTISGMCQKCQDSVFGVDE